MNVSIVDGREKGTRGNRHAHSERCLSFLSISTANSKERNLLYQTARKKTTLNQVPGGPNNWEPLTFKLNNKLRF